MRNAHLIFLTAMLSFASGATARLLVADDRPGRGLETEEVMKKNHGKKKGLMPQISALVKDGKFEQAGPLAKQFATVAADLPRNRPEKGDRKTWDELAKEYAAAGKDLSAAVEKKDAEAAKSALSSLGGSCKGCHEAFRRGKSRD